MRRAHSCSTSQSATTLTPELRSSASRRAVDGRKRRQPAVAFERRHQPLERGLASGFASAAASGAGRQHLDVAQSDAIAFKMRRQLIAIGRTALAGLREQLLRALEAPAGIGRRRRVHQHTLRDLARIDVDALPRPAP
jgi:hypothetical protein